MNDKTFDAIGIGALNLDYITEDTIEIVGPVGIETHIDHESLALLIGRTQPINEKLGGSAFNTIRAMADAKFDLNLGFVGVEGSVPVSNLSFGLEFRSPSIDREFVQSHPEHTCGVCVSLVDGNDRTLLTHEGVNVKMADHLENNFDEIVAYLSTAKIIHVTSFLDERTPPILARLLQAVKLIAPSTKISFDPGHVWAIGSNDSVQKILELSDYLFVNEIEFAAISKIGDHNDIVRARKIFQLLGKNASILLKKPEGVWRFQLHDDIVRSWFVGAEPLDADEIRDSTGAGDIFAAGFLGALASSQLRSDDGMGLGLEMARKHLIFT